MHLKQTKLKITVTLNYKKNLIQFGFVLAENINKVTNIGSVCQNIETGKASSACELKGVLDAVGAIGVNLICFFVNIVDSGIELTSNDQTIVFMTDKRRVLENEPPEARGTYRAGLLAGNTLRT